MTPTLGADTDADTEFIAVSVDSSIDLDQYTPDIFSWCRTVKIADYRNSNRL